MKKRIEEKEESCISQFRTAFTVVAGGIALLTIGIGVGHLLSTDKAEKTPVANSEPIKAPAVEKIFVAPTLPTRAFQARKDIQNHITNYFYLPARQDRSRVPTDVLVWGTGEYCKVTGFPGEYEQINKMQKTCTPIFKMSADDIAQMKETARAAGVDLVDAEIRTVVRNAEGKDLAQNTTKTFYPRAALSLQGLGNAEAVTTYDVVTLSRSGGILNNCQQSFDRTAAPATAPAIADIAKHGGMVLKDDHIEGIGTFKTYERHGVFREAGGIYNEMLAANCGTGADKPGYIFRYMDDRFKLQGKKSPLPRHHRNIFQS